MNDLSVFTGSDFDPNDYANAILAGETYPDSRPPGKPPTITKGLVHDPPPKEDVSVAISKLTFSIDEVSRQIKNTVATHHEHLLSQAAGANSLSGSLTPVRAGLNDLDSSLEKLRLKIRIPFQSLQSHVSSLHKIQQVSDILRRTSRFVVLARRLLVQMADISSHVTEDKKEKVVKISNAEGPQGQEQDVEDDKERMIAKAALSIAELMVLLDGPIDQHVPFSDSTETQIQNGMNYPKAKLSDSDTGNIGGHTISLRSVNAVVAHVPFIEEARTKVTNEMEIMVMTGLATLVRPTFFHIPCVLACSGSYLLIAHDRTSRFSHHPYKPHITSACCLS